MRKYELWSQVVFPLKSFQSHLLSRFRVGITESPVIRSETVAPQRVHRAQKQQWITFLSKYLELLKHTTSIKCYILGLLICSLIKSYISYNSIQWIWWIIYEQKSHRCNCNISGNLCTFLYRSGFKCGRSSLCIMLNISICIFSAIFWERFQKRKFWPLSGFLLGWV